MKNIERDDFIGYCFLSNIHCSEDESYVAYVRAQTDIKEDTYKKAVFLLDLQTKKTQQMTADDVESFFGFNGQELLFSARRSPEQKEAKKHSFVYGLSVNGGEARLRYEFPYPVLKLTMLDAQTALVLHQWEENPYADLSGEKADEAKKDAGACEVFEEIPFWENGTGFTSRQRNRLFLYNLADMTSTPLADEYTGIDDFDVDKSRRFIVFAKNRYTDKMTIYNTLMLYDRQTGAARQLGTAEPFMYNSVHFLDERIVYTGSDGKKYGVNQDADIYVLDTAEGAEPRRISPDDFDKSLWNSVGTDCRLGGGDCETAKDGSFYFITTEDDSSFINRIDAGGVPEKCTTEKGSVDCFAVCKKGIVFIGFRKQRLQEVYLLDGGKEERLTDHNKEAEAHTVIVPEEFRFKNGEVSLHGFVLKPADYNEEKKYPALLSIHGGPKTVFGSIFHHEMQWLAQQGYVVFYTNPRGADGMGRAFADIRGKYGAEDYSDLMCFTDEVLKRYPAVDPKRLGVMGGSYGGFMTNWIIGHTNRFAAACAQRSISNWISKFGITDIGYYFNSDQNGGATPWDGVENLWEHSPLKYADKCTTPTLFIQGDEDYRCFEACAFQMFTALKYHHCPARLVLFHGANHDLSRSGKPKQRIRRLKEIGDWFASYLKPEAPAKAPARAPAKALAEAAE